MYHTHAFQVSFLREKTVLNEFIGEEYHVVYPSIEQASQSFSKWVLCLHNRLMMPYNYGMSIEFQSPKQDDWLDSQGVGGIKNIIRLATSQHFPSGNEHISQPFVSMFLMVPDHINAVISQLQSTIKEVRGEGPLLPFLNNSFCVLCMIEVDGHLCLLISSIFRSTKARVPQRGRQ